MTERTYSQEDVAAIFARAAERQRPEAHDGAPRLTLEEVERAGRDAGLSSEAVRAAAAELDVAERYPARPEVSVAERWVDGGVVEGAWEDLVAALRHRFGASSTWWGKDTSALGAAQEWTHSATSGVRTTVTLSPRNGRTLLRVVQEDAGLPDDRTMGVVMAAFLSLIPSMLAGALVAETLGWGDLAGIVTVALVFLAGVALGSPLLAGRVRRSRDRQSSRVQRVADDLARRLDAAQGELSGTAAGESAGARLELGGIDLSDVEERSGPPTGRRRSRS